MLLKKPDELKISVVIPTHNRQEELKRALKSLFEQTVLPDEVIVVDDASQPAVNDDIFNDAPGSVSTKLLRHALPEGAASARNNGIKNASGDWIAFLDDDDTFFLNKIEKLITIIENNPNVDFIYHPALIHLVNEKVSYRTKPGKLSDIETNFSNLLSRNEIGGTSMVFVKRDLALEVGGFDKQFIPIEDYEFYLKLAEKKYVFFFYNHPLTNYYLNTKKSSLTKRIEDRNTSMKRIEVKYSDFFNQFDGKKRMQHKIRNLKAKTYIALINRNRFMAFKNQLLVFKTTKSMKDLAFSFAVLLGPRIVFKIRSKF